MANGGTLSLRNTGKAVAIRAPRGTELARTNDRIVAPRTRREVETIAEQVRLDLDLDLTGRVAMLPILEHALYDVIDGYDFQVEEDAVMGRLEGLTDTQRPIIKLRNSVYLALERGDGRSRFTAAHEFGHLMLHCGLPTYRAFSDEYQPLHDPERQANIFAAAFLMPRQAFLACRTVKEAMAKFGVSQDAVSCRARILRHSLEPTRPILTVVKKKGASLRRPPS